MFRYNTNHYIISDSNIDKLPISRKNCNLRWPAATDALLSGRIALPAATL